MFKTSNTEMMRTLLQLPQTRNLILVYAARVASRWFGVAICAIVAYHWFSLWASAAFVGLWLAFREKD